MHFYVYFQNCDVAEFVIIMQIWILKIETKYFFQKIIFKEKP
jgi:hypothetical protein